jgi:Rrf2 family protein
MLTKKAKYALKAAVHLARREPGGSVLIADIAGIERIPKKFLESILLTMKNRGLLVSRKGRGGGYALARPADEISFGEIVRIMDGPLAPVSCVSVTAYRRCEECANEETCEIRAVMKRVRDAISDVLDATTLADALRESARAGAAKAGRARRGG